MQPRDLLLIAIDDQPPSERTLDYVSSVLGEANPRDIELCHVVSSAEERDGVLGAASARLAESGWDRERIRTSTILRRPRVGIAEQLVEHAEEIDATTLVVGWDTCVHLTERFHRHLGEELAARARDVTSWVVRPEPTSARDLNVLVAVDDTAESDHTVAYVGRVLAGRGDIRIHLFHALEPVAPLAVDYAADEGKTSTKELLDDAARARLLRAEANATANLQSLCERLHDAGIAAEYITMQVTETFEQPQDVPDAIARAAHSADCATVVVGCHALSWYERLFKRHVGAQLLDATRDLTVWIPARQPSTTE